MRSPCVRTLTRVGVLLAAFVVLASTSAVDARPSVQSLAAMARHFRTLRAEVQADVDREKPELRYWDGELHRVMSTVGDRIAAERLPGPRVRELLGAPDTVVKGLSRHTTVDAPRGETHWIYEWRGGHDYLYFVLRKGRVTAARWWFAGE